MLFQLLLNKNTQLFTLNLVLQYTDLSIASSIDIKISGVNSTYEDTLTTNSSGECSFEDVPKGLYDIIRDENDEVVTRVFIQEDLRLILQITQLSNILYGRLYNWYAVGNVAGIAPAGLAMPSDADWTTLIDYLGGEDVAGGKLKEVGTEHWDSPNTGATDEVGFTALPGGRRSYDSFSFVGYLGGYWSSTVNDTNARGLYVNGSNASMFSSFRAYGFSVRMLVTDTTTYPAGSQYTDLDGNKYDVIQIGTQHWLKQNWACTKYADGSPIPNITDNTAWSTDTIGAYCNYDNDESYVFK